MPLFYLLAQAQQPQKLPWGFLVMFALLAVAAVGLIIYFLTRVRKSEKDVEEDWGLSSRGILLNSAASPQDAGKKQEVAPREAPLTPKPESPAVATAHAPAPSSLVSAEPPEPPVIAEPPVMAKPPVIAEPSVIAEALELADLHIVTEPQAAESISAAEANPPAAQRTVAELHQAPVAQTDAQLQHTDEASPFDQEVWSQLESPEPIPTASREFGKEPPRVSPHKEPYEPPRVDPIVPRTEQPLKTPLPAPDIRPPLAARQQSSASKARLEARPAPARSAKTVSAAAGSILGLPAEASAGPFIINKSAVRHDVAVGTLANYDNPPDDAAGHSGTIALLLVIVLVCGALVAYFALPSVHTSVNHWVARVRGIDDSEPPKPVAQIFQSTMDETKDPAQAKGALQNISDQPLTGLVVTISLEPRGGGAPVTEDLHVTPDEIPPGQQGAYEFQVETKKYQKYRIVGLKTKGGLNLVFVKPNQQQQ